MEKEYFRLPGKRMLAVWGIDSLWLGKDHILSIKKRGYVEEYRRFYFTDVQSILLDQTGEGIIWNLILGFAAGVCILIFGLAWRVWEWESGGLIAWGILTGIFFLGLLINALKGPTCKCFIQTAVQIDPLPSLHRTRAAKKAIQIIQPHIESIQGSVPQQDLLLIQPEYSTAAQPLFVKTSGAEQIHHESGSFHFALFGSLVAYAILSVVNLFYRNTALYAAKVAILTAILVTMIAAAVRQRNSDMNLSLKRTVWFSLALLIATVLGGYINMLLFVVRHPQAVFDEWGIMQSMIKSSPFDSPFSIISYVLSFAGSLFIAVTGIILLIRHRNVHRRQGFMTGQNAVLSNEPVEDRTDE
jgi:hypothetical protein